MTRLFRLSPLQGTALAVAGNAYLASLFLAALRSPLGWEDFIYRTAVALVMMEFFATIVGGLIAGPRSTLAARLAKEGLTPVRLLLLCGFFSAGLGVVRGAWDIVLYFIISLGAKLSGAGALPSRRRFAVSAALYFAVLALVVVMSDGVAASIPMPPEILAARPKGASGTFVEQPQVLLVWGLVYYGLCAGLEILLFVLRDDTRQGQPGHA